MRYGIVGNRIGWDESYVLDKIKEIISSQNDDVAIISGGASGIDSFAKKYAVINGISYQEFLPNTNESIPERYFNRNKLIAEKCDVLIAFNKKAGHSGTMNTIKFAYQFKKRVIVITE